MAPQIAHTPHNHHANITRAGLPRAANEKPLEVKTPAPIMFATTKAANVQMPSCGELFCVLFNELPICYFAFGTGIVKRTDLRFFSAASVTK
jgi:hypothetical protein